MNYSDKKLQSLLAAEYVMGGLRGAAARRFQKLLYTEPGLRDELEYWQYKLNPLTSTITPIQPPKRIWKKIRKRIAVESRYQSMSVWHSLVFWRGIAFASLFLMVGYMAGYFIAQQPDYEFQPKTVEYLAVLHDQQAKPSLVASVIDDGKALRLDLLMQQQSYSEQVMQVWCVPKDGGDPLSIGFIDSGSNRFEMSVEQMRELHDAQEITVSLEPLGGSPLPGPSGEIMYRGDII